MLIQDYCWFCGHR